MKTSAEISQALASIREAIDIDIVDTDMHEHKNKLTALSQLMGLSAETMAATKRLLQKKEHELALNMDKNLSPQKFMKMLQIACAEENELVTYADRLNSALSHSMDAIRTIISYTKSEMENSLKG